MLWKLCALLAVAALAVAGSALAAAERTTATSVTVTAGKPSELKFTLSKKSVAKGAVTFKVTNRGALAHDFRIAGKKTKLLRKGQSATLRVVLARAGKFPYLCTVPGHAAGGMKGTLTVK
ncbi:MAG TPA: cupredoxin domain-containing protein [Gaiella sp.]|nr:cupredoxin domain-containing protein [Gaiella sp.]